MKKVFLCMAAFILISGCAKKQILKPAEQPAAVTEQTQKEPEIRFADWQNVRELRAISFDYDKSDLLPGAREILKQNANYLQANMDLNILVEGHCDERGTTEYNLSLGQRRAQAVREFYGKLGISLGRIGTISYGEEKPLDPGHSEEAWAKNRRAETKVRSNR